MSKEEEDKLQLPEHDSSLSMFLWKENINITLLTLAFCTRWEMLLIEPISVEGSWCPVWRNHPRNHIYHTQPWEVCPCHLVTHTPAVFILVFQTPARYTKRKIIFFRPGLDEGKRISKWKQGIIQPDLDLTPSGYCSLTLHCKGTKKFACSSCKMVLYSHNKLLFQQSKHFPTGKHYHLKQILLHDCESNLQSFS